MSNILHLTNSLSLTNGISKMISLLMRSLGKNYVQIAASPEGDAFDYFNQENLKSIKLKYQPTLTGLFNNYNSIKKIILDYDINIVHSHHRYYDLVSYMIAKRHRKIKTVTSVHSKVRGLYFISYKSPLIHTVSNAIKNHLINEFKIHPKRIKVIYNFIETNFTNNTSKLNIKTDSNQSVIGFVGRFSKEKGIDILLEAYKNLSAAENVLLVLVGDGEEKDFVRKYISSNKLNVKIFSPTSNVYELMQQFDILVLPSRVDPFPLVMLEAGLLKKPFIGSNVDGIAEFITNEETGLLINPENPEELEAGIIRILSDTQLKNNLAINLNKKVLAGFTVEHLIVEYHKLYSEVLKN